MDDLKSTYRGTSARVRKYFSPLADRYTRGTASTLAQYGGQQIVRIVVFRQPLMPMLIKLGDFLSRGAVTKAKNELGYEKFFHLGTYVTLANGVGLAIEKRDVIGIAVGPLPAGEGAEYVPVILAAPLTLSEYMERTRAAMGDEDFFLYSALPMFGKPANNCQVFARALLAANGMLTPQLEAFIMQSLEKVAARLPRALQTFVKVGVDAIATTRKIIGGGRGKRQRTSGGGWADDLKAVAQGVATTLGLRRPEIGALTTLATAAPRFRGAAWMGDLLAAGLGSRRLSELALPGAHDAATSTISWKSTIAEGHGLPPALNNLRYIGVGFIVNKVIAAWSRAQGASVQGLLNMGVRYLDLRLVRKTSDRSIWTAHGLYGEPLEGVLRAVAAFLAASPTEVVIVDIQDFGNIAEGERPAVMGIVASRLGGKMVTNPAQALAMPLAELLKTPERALVLTDTPSDSLYRKKWLTSPWWNSQSVAEFTSKLATYMGAYTPNPPYLNVIQAVLTPNGDTIKAGAFGRGPASLEAFSRLLRPVIGANLKGWLGKTGGSVVMVDFADPDLCNAIISVNLQLPRT